PVYSRPAWICLNHSNHRFRCSSAAVSATPPRWLQTDQNNASILYERVDTPGDSVPETSLNEKPSASPWRYMHRSLFDPPALCFVSIPPGWLLDAPDQAASFWHWQ